MYRDRVGTPYSASMSGASNDTSRRLSEPAEQPERLGKRLLRLTIKHYCLPGNLFTGKASKDRHIRVLDNMDCWIRTDLEVLTGPSRSIVENAANLCVDIRTKLDDMPYLSRV